MSNVRRSLILGDALSTLNVQRTAAGRRRIILRAQVPFLVLESIVLGAVVRAGLPADTLETVLIAWVGTLLWTTILWFVPWERRAELSGIVVAGVDLVAVAAIDTATASLYPTIGVLQVLPIVIMSFAFGLAGLISAILGTYIVSFAPLFAAGSAPSDSHGWVSALLTPICVSFVAIAVHFFSLLLQRSQRQLRLATSNSEAAAAAAENEQAVIMTVLNTMDVGTAFVRPDNSTAFTNSAFRSLVRRSGVDPETMAGTRVFGTDRQTRIPPEEQMLAQAARGDYFESRLYWIGEPGDQRAILVTARPVLGRDDQHMGSAFVSKDVTELTDAIRAREDFLAGVSHELRTPLTSIIGYLEIIEDSVDAEAAGIGHELAIIQRNANQLMMRIGDLLHVTDDSVALRPRAVDIPRVVQQAVDAIRFRAESSDITMTANLVGSFTAAVDPGRFSQVLDNLLTNAVKYTPRGGNVEVSLRLEQAAFVVAVADSGTGIAPAEMGRVFERFYRADAVRGSAISGVGLGLSIVRSIVEAHRGTVRVESRIGVGTTFTVSMPRL